MKLSPEEIFFSHDSISHRFSCGRFIEDTYQQLRDGDIHVSIIPRMTVTDIDGEWFAFNGNRRLWVFKKLAWEGRLQTIQVYVTDQRIPRKRFTTEVEGRRIEVRHRRDLDFPPPGPGLAARFRNKSTEQSFLDSVGGDGVLKTLALSYDQTGYFLFKKNGDWKYRGMSSRICDLMDKQESHSVEPAYVASGDDDRYFVKFEDGSMHWHGHAPKAFSKTVKKAAKVHAVAFGPRGGWWIKTNRGSQWNDLPEVLEETLQQEDQSADFVSVSEAGDAWFAEFPDGSYWEGLDDKCLALIDEHGQRVSRITFGHSDDIVLEFY